MDIEIWHIWILFAVLLLIVEIFTSGFFVAAVALGCIAAGIAAGFGAGIKLQLLLFSIGTLVGFFGVRPFMMKYAHSKSDKIKTNADALVGKTGQVIETINHSLGLGRVMLDGEDWRAQTADHSIIEIGESVRVMEVNSTILIVQKVNQ